MVPDDGNVVTDRTDASAAWSTHTTRPIRPSGPPWVGTNAPRGPGFTSIVLVASAVPDSLSIAGLVIDEWTETVPNAVETAAVGLHYADPPNRPPPVVLLAVAPTSPPPDWSCGGVEAGVKEALGVPKRRGIAPTLGQAQCRAEGQAQGGATH